jgi:O-antigen/teichoic acid export membrane protein
VSATGGIRGAVRGFAALAAATIAGQVIGFVALAIVARRVGPGNLGDYAFAAVFTAYVFVITDPGVSVYAIRQVARAPERTREVAGEVVGLRLALFVVIAAIVAPLSALIAPNSHARVLILILSVSYLPAVLGLDWVLRARGRFGVMAILTLAGQVVYGALVPILVTGGYSGTRTYAWLNVAGLAITFLGASATAVWAFGWPVLRARARALWGRLRSSSPLGVTLILGGLYTGVNTLLLGYLRPPQDVGEYGVALRLPLGLTLLSSVWISAFLPHASELAGRDPRRLLGQIGRLVGLATVVALPIATIGAVLATPLMSALFGPEFAGAGAPFRWLIIWAAIAFVATNYNNALLAFDDERWLMRGTAAAVLVTVALTFALAPPLGPAGAAFGAVVAECALVAYSIRRLTRRAGPVTLETGRIVRAVLLTAGTAGLVLALREVLPAVACAALSGVVYAAGAMACGAITPAEVRVLLRREREAAQPATAAASSASSSGSTASGV